MAYDTDRVIMPRIVPSAQVEDLAAVQGQSRPNGESQTDKNANPRTSTIGASAKKSQKKQPCQSAGNNGRKGIPEGKCAAFRVRQRQGNRNTGDSNAGHANLSYAKPRSIRCVRVQPAIVVLNRDRGETVEIRRQVCHGSTEERRQEQAS